MGHTPAVMTQSVRTFSEREFYLAEFRGRSIGIAWPADVSASGRADVEPLMDVIKELTANGSRVVLLSPSRALFSAVGISAATEASDSGFAPALWRDLRDRGCGGLILAEERFEEECRRIALTLRLAKVVWVQSSPPVERLGDDARVSVIDLAHLEPLLARNAGEDESLTRRRVRPGCAGMLAAIRDMIEGGIPSVNVCAPGQLAEELFTYAGAGTFFTRDRYAEVRPLAIDDYDFANDLIERGEVDGFLAPRDQQARDSVLAHGVGVFIEGRYLAGIGAILPHTGANAAELVSLFALTRYVGEGAGAQIVRYAIEQSRAAGLDYLFSCTTSERVEGFFERHGFERVDPSQVPAEKWDAYDPERRAHVRCLRINLVD